VTKDRWTVSCLLCKIKGTGAVIQCSHKRCARSVHPICVFTSSKNEFHRDENEKLIYCKQHAPNPFLKPESKKKGKDETLAGSNTRVLVSSSSGSGSSSNANTKKKSSTTAIQTHSSSSSFTQQRHATTTTATATTTAQKKDEKCMVSEPSVLLLPSEPQSQLTIEDVDMIISKLKAHISDRDLVRLLFSECLIHAYASGSYHANLSIAEKKEWTVEHLLRRNEMKILRTLHDYDLINLRLRTNENRPTLLYLAVECDVYECCEMLLDLGTDIDAYSADEGPLNSALHSAAKFGFLEILDLLLDRGANVNIVNHHDETPLIIACRQGHLDCVKSLLRFGANVFQKTKSEDDAFQIATRARNAEILRCVVTASEQQQLHAMQQKEQLSANKRSKNV